MSQPFEDFLVEVHDNAQNAREDVSVALLRIRGYLDGHLAGRGSAALASERRRLAGAFRDKGLTTELSQRIWDMMEGGEPQDTTQSR